MEPIFYISNKCRFCQSKELELVLPLAPSPMCDKYLHKKQFQEIFPLDLSLKTPHQFAITKSGNGTERKQEELLNPLI